MRIEHIALYTGDIERMKDFYTRYFGCKANKKYTNPNGFSSYFLSFSDGARLEIMSLESGLEGFGNMRLGYVHLAVSVGSEAKVDEITDELKGDGYAVRSYPRTTGDGYYESVVCDPDGNLIEITV